MIPMQLLRTYRAIFIGLENRAKSTFTKGMESELHSCCFFKDSDNIIYSNAWPTGLIREEAH